MATYRIHPLKVAELTAPVGILSMGGDMQSLMKAPVYIFFLEGGEKKIVMDAGISAPDAQGNVHGFPIVGGGEQGIRSALESVGTAPEEIDILVLSHLHFDHCAGTSLFRNARIFVQKKEWKTAFCPVPTARVYYEQPLFQSIEQMDLVLIEGDCPIADGVSSLFLPGHTEGLQGLAVSTAEGTAVLTGDLCYTYYNLNPSIARMTDLDGVELSLPPRPDLPFTPPAVHINLTDWYDSVWKAVSTASRRDLILPGHDPALASRVFG